MKTAFVKHIAFFTLFSAGNEQLLPHCFPMRCPAIPSRRLAIPSRRLAKLKTLSPASIQCSSAEWATPAIDSTFSVEAASVNWSLPDYRSGTNFIVPLTVGPLTIVPFTGHVRTLLPHLAALQSCSPAALRLAVFCSLVADSLAACILEVFQPCTL